MFTVIHLPIYFLQCWNHIFWALHIIEKELNLYAIALTPSSFSPFHQPSVLFYVVV